MSQRDPNMPGSSNGGGNSNADLPVEKRKPPAGKKKRRYRGNRDSGRVSLNPAGPSRSTGRRQTTETAPPVGLASNETAERCIRKLFLTMAEGTTQGGGDICKATLKRNVKDLRPREKANKQLKAMRWLMENLRTSNKDSVDIVVKQGVVPICMEFLKDNSNEDFQFGAAFALQYILAGCKEQVEVVVDAGAINLLTKMMQSTSQPNRVAAACVLGTIAASKACPEHFDIYKLIVPPFVELIKASHTTLLRFTVWGLVHIFNNYRNLVPEHVVQLCIPELINLLAMTDMEEVANVCTALLNICRLADGGLLGMIVDQFVEAGVVPRMMELLDGGDDSVITPCIQVVRHYVNSSASRAQHFINSGVLPSLANVLESDNVDTVGYAAWTVRIIAKLCPSERSKIVEAEIVPMLVDVVDTGKPEAQKHAVSALKSIAKADEDHVLTLCDAGAISVISDMLHYEEDGEDTDSILLALKAIKAILTAAERFDHREAACTVLEECGGLDLIDALQSHPNVQLYLLAFAIIKDFFGD